MGLRGRFRGHCLLFFFFDFRVFGTGSGGGEKDELRA